MKSIKKNDLQKVQDNITDKQIQDFLNNKNNIILFNIESTTRCNNSCTYCHVYDRKYDRKCGTDMDIKLFEAYMDFINFFAKKTKGMVQFRFSGGDPIVLGDKLFEMAEIGFKKTSITPYILTAGKGINEDWIKKARASHLQYAFISVENPFDQDPGANKTDNVIEVINKYNHDDFQLLLGVCIIKNKRFGNLLEICDYFFDKTGQIPTLHELNYGQFEKPSKKELKILKDQIEKVLEKYGDKVLIRMFPSVFPELSFGSKMVYLSDLPVKDSRDFLNKTNEERFKFMARRFIGYSYPNFDCKKECELKDFCKNIKWFRRFNNDGKNEKRRIDTYCKIKNILSDVYLKIYDK